MQWLNKLSSWIRVRNSDLITTSYKYWDGYWQSMVIAHKVWRWCHTMPHWGKTHWGKIHWSNVWHIVRPVSSARAPKTGARLTEARALALLPHWGKSPLRKKNVDPSKILPRSWQDLMRSCQDCSNFDFWQDLGKILASSCQDSCQDLGKI